MPETVRVTFLYAIGQHVRYADEPRVYTIGLRTYTERAVLGPVVTYRLEHPDILPTMVYEPDIVAHARRRKGRNV